MERRGVFLTLEGGDGVGKSTQARLLKEWLESKSKKVVLTREPGGGPASDKIRAILLDPSTKIENITELLLYQAARSEHVAKVIRPALERGDVVVCDRYTDATIAYQGFARGLAREVIENLNRVATQDLSPDLTFLLDLDPHTALKKAQARVGKADRLENEGVDFQARVRTGYLALAQENPERIKVIQVQPQVEQTQQLLRTQLSQRFGL